MIHNWSQLSINWCTESCLGSGLCWYKMILAEHNSWSSYHFSQEKFLITCNQMLRKRSATVALLAEEIKCRDYIPFIGAESQPILRMHIWAHRLVMDKSTEIKTVGITLLFLPICSNLIQNIFFELDMGQWEQYCMEGHATNPRPFSGFLFLFFVLHIWSKIRFGALWLSLAIVCATMAIILI